MSIQKIMRCIVSIALIGALIIIGCTGDDDDDPTPTATPTKTPTITPTPTPTIPPPVISDIVVDGQIPPARVQEDNTVKVTWSVIDADTWTITSSMGNYISPASGSGSGNKSFDFRGDILGSDTVTIAATNAGGTSQYPFTIDVVIHLIEDPLDGSTLGTQFGAGQFVSGGGWKSSGGFIAYDLKKIISKGYFEAKMRGWTAPAQGAERSNVLNGWELVDKYTHYRQTGSFWNWRIGTNYNPFKVLASPQGLSLFEEAHTGSNSAVNAQDEHTYRVEWRSGTITFYFDGAALHGWAFNRFEQGAFTIGKDDLLPITNPAPIISDVIIHEYLD
ncbi:hypothetical protein ACFL27_00790 [candidate division CSSED10-310 bacterium]|uniref:GH16 domain-containing protein n=1 Tax=candidate division CSSED10-310 bacterium TaxID=2855610 RepID=A0ABV6YR82_UNCC1